MEPCPFVHGVYFQYVRKARAAVVSGQRPVYPFCGGGGDSGFSALSEEDQNAVVESFQHVVRKGAHFSIYLFLGVLCLLAMQTHRVKPAVKIGVSLGICLLYAASDEFHQLFIDGRSGQVSDVLLDFCGSAVGVLLTAGAAALVCRHLRKRTSPASS